MEKYDLSVNYMAPMTDPVALKTNALNVTYLNGRHALFDASLLFPKHQVTALIGASGSGKSTFLRCLNRMNDRIATVDGQIMYQDVDINTAATNIYAVRKQIGMVFQLPTPFAKTIAENITFAPKAHGMKDKHKLQELVETSLRSAALWDEVKDDLDESALALSGGQQQRLCIARALAMAPDILLLDEPASALDPISTSKVEDTIVSLAKKYTVIIVTHNMQQARRISDYTAFFHLGHVLEFDHTKTIFEDPQIEATHDYVTGSFG